MTDRCTYVLLSQKTKRPWQIKLEPKEEESMPQIDVNTLNHADGQLPEATEYVIKLFLPAINLLAAQVSELSETVSVLKTAALSPAPTVIQSDFTLLVGEIEKLKASGVSQDNLNSIWRACETLLAQKAQVADLNMVVSKLDTFVPRVDLISSIILLSNKIEALGAAIILQAAKLDADFAEQNLSVAGSTLDTNYAATLGL